ncbi:MAG: peptidylprolyl isomerase [Betaproteobacteria bacterium HGW-Betaproteobacteria-1]|jgi:peptidyl-prolyl cis-trans isomerase D|nr:MAG: peptidylprolyl isomerase [Betaproteobacteria bacterium HGW-Betaproteobacteria-1]
MLEAIRARTKGWLAKVILALITVPFALFGIDQYLQGAGSNVPIAKVDGDAITVQEFGNALQNLRNRLQSEGQTDLTILDRPELRQSVLDKLINDRLLSVEVKRANFSISDEQLSQYITSMPEFSVDGKFSEELYYQLLTQNRLTLKDFESSIRQDLKAQQAREGFASLAYIPDSLVEQTLKAELQEREVSVAEIKTADYLSEVSIEPAQVQEYYEKNKDRFQVPEQVQLEFVLMSANTLLPTMQVTEEEVRKFFDDNADQFQGDEERRASHILIGFGLSPTPAAKEEARSKAEQILEEVKKNPEQFAELARKHSQDPGSAQNGGDLGMFGRGVMVKSFDDAVFSMAPGAISDLVESEFGYHIIKLTEISGEAVSLASVAPQIRGELIYQKALAKFTENAEDFSNIVYEQSTSLEPAAKAFGLDIQKTPWMSREDVARVFKSDRMRDQVFTEEVLKDGRNTEAVEVAPNSLMVARVAEYKPAAPRTFEEVQSGIEEFLRVEAAAKIAIAKGETALADLRAGKETKGLEWIPPVVVDRKNAQGLTDLTMSNAFKIKTDTLPAYAGVADANKGFLLIKVSAVNANLPEDENARQAAKVEMQTALAAEYVDSYLKALRAKGEVSVNQQLMQSGVDN